MTINKLKVCWCEQSGIIEDRETLANALRKNDIDYYRYNWKYGHEDLYANVKIPGRLSWSMGRSLLYEQAARQGGYDYYIFADDDVIFLSDPEESLRLLREFLNKYQPLTACLASSNWHDSLRRKIPQSLRARVHPYILADLEVQIFSGFIARETFPCIFDGGWRTLWYPNIAVWLYASSRQLQFNEVSIDNARKNREGFYGGIDHPNLADIIDKVTFNQTTPRWFRAVLRRYGVQDSAKFINACLSVRNIRGPMELSTRAEAAILRYFEAARGAAANSPSDESRT